MISQDVALFDVDQAGAVLGQIAVKVETPGERLSRRRAWVVEPMGVISGTNAFGAAVQIPLVRFQAYSAQLEECSEWWCGE